MTITGGMYMSGPMKYCGYCDRLEHDSQIVECADCEGEICTSCGCEGDLLGEYICENCNDMKRGNL